MGAKNKGKLKYNVGPNFQMNKVVLEGQGVCCQLHIDEHGIWLYLQGIKIMVKKKENSYLCMCKLL